MSPKIQITAKGIRSALKKYTPYQSLIEYVWNGFDAKATTIKIDFIANELGNIESISIHDNGYGINHKYLTEKFEPLFESQKKFENKLKKNQSAIHGKNGTGRLTFFCFARNAVWKTVYAENELCFTYEIYANAENINLFTGVNALPRHTTELPGTTITFSGIHGLTAYQLEEKFRDFLLKEFAWFLALNSENNFSININGVILDWRTQISDSEEIEIFHEKSQTSFNLRYIHWSNKNTNESSHYYYLDSLGREQWKENSAIKNKGEHFYHSVFVKSPYFDSFSFQGKETINQDPLLSGTRSDAQFRFMRKKIANFLRIKRRPFLKDFAEKLILEYQEKNILSKNEFKPRLSNTIKTLFEMQPRIFSALNLEQKKLLIGLIDNLIESDKKGSLSMILKSIIELTEEEQVELNNLLADNPQPESNTIT